MEGKPLVSIVIVTWNSESWIHRCLSSIFAHTSEIPFEVIIVDNASEDQTVQIAMNSFTGVKVIKNPDNKGWATAVNQGIEASQGQYICVLNPDTELVDRTIEQLAAFLTKYPQVGIVAPHLMNEDESTQVSIRRRPRLSDQLMIILKLHVLFPDAKVIRRYLYRRFNYKETQEVEQVMGACMMIRRTVFDEVGIFDENFFLWFDEVDFCRRVYDRSNFKIYYEAHTHLIHAGGDSFDQVRSKKKQKWYLRSVKYYFRKHGHWFSYFVLLFFTPLSYMINWFGGFFRKSKKGKQMKERTENQFKKTS
jgi:GT2 family glycosyltransferase